MVGVGAGATCGGAAGTGFDDGGGAVLELELETTRRAGRGETSPVLALRSVGFVSVGLDSARTFGAESAVGRAACFSVWTMTLSVDTGAAGTLGAGGLATGTSTPPLSANVVGGLAVTTGA